jgi:hypothetical protein
VAGAGRRSHDSDLPNGTERFFTVVSLTSGSSECTLLDILLRLSSILDFEFKTREARNLQSPGNAPDRRPIYLKIDIKTLDVTVPEKVFGLEDTSTRRDLGFLGRTFLSNGRPVRVHSGVAITPNSRQILFHDDWLYRPGPVWVREHAGTGKREHLQARQLPSRYWNLQVGSSAHYGLVTFDRYDRALPLSRVIILDGTPDGDAP